MVRGLREQLSESSSDREIARDAASEPRLYRDARPQLATELVIRDEVGESQDTDVGTRVYYTLSTVTPRDEREKKAISDHYRRAARAIPRKIPGQDIWWFDGVRTNSDGLRTSLDVIISSSGTFRRQVNSGNRSYPVSSTPDRPGQTFTVETIAVVAADPRNPANVVGEVAQSN